MFLFVMCCVMLYDVFCVVVVIVCVAVACVSAVRYRVLVVC